METMMIIAVIYLLIGIGFSAFVYTSVYDKEDKKMYIFATLFWPCILFVSLLLWIVDFIDKHFGGGGFIGGGGLFA